MSDKKKLNFEEQIEDMKKKGIQFHIISEEEALSFIQNNNYYFKLKSYAKNYDTYVKGNRKGQYIHLEFAYLRDLSIIDMGMRTVLLEMVIDIEHFLKTELNRVLSMDAKEDGYTIVSDFLSFRPQLSITHNKYTKSLVEKNEGHFAYWNFIEVLTLGDFLRFYKFYISRRYIKKVPADYKNKIHLFDSLRRLRNACAHNNCLMNNLRSDSITPTEYVASYLGSRTKTSNSRKLKHYFLHDFTAVLILYKILCRNEPMYYMKRKKLKKLIYCMKHNAHYYEKNSLIHSSFQFLETVIDNIFE